MSEQKQRPCAQCGQAFTPARAGTRYCERQCRWDASNGVDPSESLARKGKLSLPALTVPNTAVILPDLQVKPEGDTRHLEWFGQWMRDRYDGVPNVDLIQVGDWADMESLSSYDRKGGRAMEGRRYTKDVDAHNASMELLEGYLPRSLRRKVKLRGNHEARILRVVEHDAQMEGLVGYHHLNDADWEVVDFREIIVIEGVAYSHYFENGMGRPYTGAIETRLKNIGHSFTQGHQQGILLGNRHIPALARHHWGLVAGSFYLHREPYMGPQRDSHWNGIVVCNNVRDGEWDPMVVRMEYLCERYEGITLDEYRARTGQ